MAGRLHFRVQYFVFSEFEVRMCMPAEAPCYAICVVDCYFFQAPTRHD